jgi:hypothetical protein
MATGPHIFAPSDDRLIFWISWVFLITQYPQRLVDKCILIHHIPRTFAAYGYIFFMFFLGMLLWHLLHIGKFSPVKNIVIGLQGFFLFHLFFFAAWLGLFLLANTYLHGLPRWISSAFGIIAFYSATFLGGCWIGYKNGYLMPLWCICAVAILYYVITMRVAAFNANDIFFVVASVGTSIIGGYTARRFMYAPET